MASGALPSIEGWMGRPLWGRRAADEGRRLAEGVFFSNQKNTPSRFPRKIVRGDGVVTSSISLAAAQRAPAHSFRCSSFSHRKTLRWEPCISPLTTPLKRPKERPAGLSFGILSGVGRGIFGTKDVGTGTGDGGGVVAAIQGSLLWGRRGHWGPGSFGGGIGWVSPCGGRGAARRGRRALRGLRRRPRGTTKNRRKDHQKGPVPTTIPAVLSEAESAERAAGQIWSLPDDLRVQHGVHGSEVC